MADHEPKEGKGLKGLLKKILQGGVPPEALYTEPPPPQEARSNSSRHNNNNENEAPRDVDQLWDMMASAPAKAREFIPDVPSKKAL